MLFMGEQYDKEGGKAHVVVVLGMARYWFLIAYKLFERRSAVAGHGHRIYYTELKRGVQNRQSKSSNDTPETAYKPL